MQFTTDTSRYTFNRKVIFTFTRGTHRFQSPMYSQLCSAVLENGKVCGIRTTKIHPFCAACTKRIFHVEVAPSKQGPDAGLGLFAYNPDLPSGEPVFRKGEFITCYAGEVSRDVDSTLRYTKDNEEDKPVCCPYSITRSDNVEIDASLLRGPASYTNDSKTKQYNVQFCESPVLGIEALRDIQHGEELLVGYGASYWDAVHGTCTITELN